MAARQLRVWFAGVLLGLCGTALRAQTSPSAQALPDSDLSQRSAAGSENSRVSSNAKLAIGDLVEISVYGVPDLSTKTRVSGSGDIYLPLIDYVHVADLTVNEAQELIQKRLEDGGFVRAPHVSIYVDESASQNVTVLGEVMRPGSYSAIGDRRLFDVISAAGGLSDKAGRAVTIEHRDDPDHKIILPISNNLADDTQSNVEIRPGDTVIVSKAGIIYVVGDVNHPSGFMIEDNSMTVLKALALAGGSTKTSALNRTKILRQTSSGIQEVPVPLKKILYAKAPDIPLNRGDVLFIPGSAAKTAAYQTASAAMALSTSLAIIAIQ